MTTQPMPLEEAKAVLLAYKKHLDDCESYDASMLSGGEKVRLSAITAALHHLEAGKRDAERLDKIEAIGDFEGFRMTLSGKFSFVTSDVFVAPTLREAIDLALAEPTTEPQG